MDYECFPPPIHRGDLGRPPPGSILLDVLGYISSRTNATTAEGFSTTKKRIKVTFWAAHPPRASCFTVYSPDVELSAKRSRAPQIINTEDDLVLLRVPICSPPYGDDFFVYQAGTENKGPSLDLVTKPLPERFNCDYKLGLLRCRDRDMYFVAILSRAAFHEALNKYNLHLYSSATGTWSTKSMTCLDRQISYECSGKVITLGGELGSVGWVDLWQGILICDILLDNDELRYIPLPSPALPRPYWVPTAVAFRDIIVLEGLIKYFEMYVPLNGAGGWEAVEWIRKDSWMEWTKHRVIKVSVDLEAEIKELPTLNAYSGFPALSFHDADVVYIMDSRGYTDKAVAMVAVDMRKQTLKGKAGYIRRIPSYYSFYCGSGISKHLRWTSSPRRNPSETSTNEIVQAGKEEDEVPRGGVQSRQAGKEEDEEDEVPRGGVQSRQAGKEEEIVQACKEEDEVQSRQACKEEEIVQSCKEEVKFRREGVQSRRSRKCREKKRGGKGRCQGSK